MKIKTAILTVIVILMTFASPSFAIEGLTISLEGTNVVLKWPSDPNSGASFTIQSKESLDTNSTWVTLADSYPASEGTNQTSFVHTNGACIPVGGGSGGGPIEGPPFPGNFSMSFQSNDFPPLPPLPWDTNAWRNNLENFESVSSFNSEEDSGTGVCYGFYRVVRNGVSLFGLTNETILHGTVTFPIELAATNENVLAINLYANGAPCAGATVQTNELGLWILQWDTTSVSNGNYTIHLEADFGDAAVVGLSNSVTVSNLISFPYFGINQFFNDQMWIDAELSVAEADYRIDIYDDQDNYLGHFEDSTSNGLISFIWNLSAANPPFTNDGFRAEFFITPAGTVAAAAATPNAKKFFFREGNWNPTGFVIAFGAVDGNGTTTGKIDDMVREGVVDVLSGYYTLSPGNTPLGAAFQLLPNSMNTFTNALKNFRHLYWFGHGSETTISPYNTDARLTFLKIQNLLKNYQNGTNYINRHPYRFVFIDGCENGKGDFCTAFGIPAMTVDRNFFGASGLLSRAYLGFKKEIKFNMIQYDWRTLMLQGFFQDWASNLPLHTCVSNAARRSIEPMPDSWVIYGATNLQRNLP